jgi:hypothetical protein
MTVCLYSRVDRYPFDAQYTIVVWLSIPKLQNNIFFYSFASFTIEDEHQNKKVSYLNIEL